jgi:hypothetical protein
VSAPAISIGAPLALSAGEPAVYGALGAIFHLETLRPDDEARLEAATTLCEAWIGDQLRFTSRSCDAWVTPFRPADLEYIACYVRDLAEPKVDDPATQLFASNLVKTGLMDYEVSCKGGESERGASPYLLRFCAEIPEVGRGPLFEPYAVLVITVPDTWPLDDFHAKVTAIAATLRLRWGAAGLTYATWPLQDLQTPAERIYAHARRHPGYDVGYFHSDMQRWHEQLRTVNWLTFLGPALRERLEAERGKPLQGSRQIGLHAAGDAVCVVAGAAPEPGDVNRLGYPRAYLEADALLRPIRASDGRAFVFHGRFTESTLTDWLRRFERRLF